MALAKVKTEMTGTGGGRWTTREDAKTSSKTIRRRIDIAEMLSDIDVWDDEDFEVTFVLDENQNVL